MSGMLLDVFEAYLSRIPDDKHCENCMYWHLEPYKQRTGVCLHRWMPDVKYDGDSEGGWIASGAYGRTLTWCWCEAWTPIMRGAK